MPTATCRRSWRASARAYPGVELTVMCEPSVDLVERIDANDLDLAIITDCGTSRPSEIFRQERLLWVTSNRHSTHHRRAAAAGARPADLRLAARRHRVPGDRSARPHRILYTSVECRRDRGRGAVRACGLGVSGIRLAPGHAGARARPTASPNCRRAGSDWCAIRTNARRSPTRSPSTSSPRSTICPRPGKRPSSAIRLVSTGPRRLHRAAGRDRPAPSRSAGRAARH